MTPMQPGAINENETTDTSVTQGTADMPSAPPWAIALAAARRECRDGMSPFLEWHLARKFTVMSQLFEQYVAPESRFLDMACGSGDGLLLASLLRPDAELWGLDIDRQSLDLAARKVPGARLHHGDLLTPPLRLGHFDVVHEFGATFFFRDWNALARVYMSLLRDDGILLWELPQKWSAGHLAYLLSWAPKITEADTKPKRFFRSFLPSKYKYETDEAVLQALEQSGVPFEVLGRVPIWYFFCNGVFATLVNRAARARGIQALDALDRINGRFWPRYSGYYLVVRRCAPRRTRLVDERPSVLSPKVAKA